MFLNYLRTLLLKLGVSIERATSEAQLRAIAELYWPIKPSGIDLVRIGGDADGGCVVPNCFDDIRECYSPGVDSISEFEIHLTRFGISSHLIDCSVDQPPGEFCFGSFTKKFLGPVTQGSFITMEDWIKKVQLIDSSDAILQMDIEGAEYASILSCPEDLLSAFRIIVIELHGLEALSNRWFSRIFNDFSNKLMKNHKVVHLHPNNFSSQVSIRGFYVNPLLEVTLLRNDYIGDSEPSYVTSFPGPLDFRNLANRKDVKLSPDWYCSN